MSILYRMAVLIFLCLGLAGCSWTHYVVLINQSDADITVTYEWFPKEPDQLTTIFTDQVKVYPAVEKYHSHKPVMYKSAEKNKQSITLTLPKNHSMVFGELRNDEYKHHSQNFINGTVFNFKKMTIITPQRTLLIPKHRFDDFFKLEKGLIKYVVTQSQI